MSKAGFMVFHGLIDNGPGSLNANQDGSPKSIFFGEDVHLRTSPQKNRREMRQGLRAMGIPCCIQTRELLPELVALARRPEEVNDDAAKVFCKELLAKFLKHKEKEEKEESDEPLTDKEKAKEDKVEIARYTARQRTELCNIAKERGQGKTVDVKKLVFKTPSYSWEEMELDLAAFGGMRPDKIMGFFKVAGSIGVNASNAEKDFFTASDDLLTSSSQNGNNAHVNNKWVSSFMAYGYSVINLDQMLEYFKGDKEKVNQYLQVCLDLIIKHAPKSDSVSCPNQGNVFYIMVEKAEEQPVSLEIAFQKSVNTSEQAIKVLRDYKQSRDVFHEKTVPFADAAGIPLSSIQVGTMPKVREFVKL